MTTIPPAKAEQLITQIKQAAADGKKVSFEIHCNSREEAEEISAWMKENYPAVAHNCIWIEPGAAMLKRQEQYRAEVEKLERWKRSCAKERDA
jgi:hypothetical protein